MRFRYIVIGLLALASTNGCSKKEEQRYRISGTVTFNKQNMPFGEVLFTPEGANAGPQGIAYIRDGKFDSSQLNGKGYAGGPTTIRVTGLSRQDGGVICEYEYTQDLPRGETTIEIVVPEKEIKKGPSKEI